MIDIEIMAEHNLLFFTKLQTPLQIPCTRVP